MHQIRKQIVTAIIMIGLLLGNLQFVNWICYMAFDNTCIEMEEQFIDMEIKEQVSNIVSSIDFGKKLDNYYGMDQVLKDVSNISEGNLKVVITDKNVDILYVSFEESEENVKDLAQFYDVEFKHTVQCVGELGESVEFRDKDSLVYPIYQNETDLQGYMVVVYEKSQLLEQGSDSGVQKVLFLILAVVSVLLVGFLLLVANKRKEKVARTIPIALLMAGMLVFIVWLFGTYRDKYQELITSKANDAMETIQQTVEGVIDSGLVISELDRIEDYLEKKQENLEIISDIKILEQSEMEDTKDAIVLAIADGKAHLQMEINQQYITDKINTMTLTFGAVFVVCLMFTFELTHMVEVLSVRFSSKFNKREKPQLKAVSAQIRILSFVGYTAIYTSMPYAAVIMRNWDVSVFGLSKSLSASLPLTVELVSVLVVSAIIQKFYKGMKLNRFMIFIFPALILGNFACTAVSSPYLLIGLRAFCGIGFAFMKYWLNNIVANGSENEKDFNENCGMLNAGLLGGITIGASLGSILAEALGYQSNYVFTAVIFLILFVWGIFTTPWKILDIAENTTKKAEDKTEKSNLGTLIKNPKVLFTILLGCVPLNIGLMYVVAFIPSYMSCVGHSAVATSYVYLINGLAGVYLGMIVLKFMKKKPLFISATSALFLASAGILVLLLGSSLGVILISAGVLGLFDGFGTPSITSYFSSLSNDKTQTAGMLTIFNMVGSAVQILCPMLYNSIIQPDGQTTYLKIFGIVYLVIAVLFMFTCRPKGKEAAN